MTADGGDAGDASPPADAGSAEGDGRADGRRGRGRRGGRRRGGRNRRRNREAAAPPARPAASAPQGGPTADRPAAQPAAQPAAKATSRPPAKPVVRQPAKPATTPPAASPAEPGRQAQRPARERPQRARREVSAGGVVYRVAAGEDGQPLALFLLIRDSYRNWGFPKGHLEQGEQPDAAALREVAEETGLATCALRGEIETIDWYFRFRGRLIHKVCHFYLMETERAETSPQLAEGITACRWAPFEEAERLVSYANAREVLRRAHVMVRDGAADGASVTVVAPGDAAGA